MDQLGLLPKVLEKGNEIDAIHLRRYEDGELLCERPGGKDIVDLYGYAWLFVASVLIIV
jgi:hypothetical protein